MTHLSFTTTESIAKILIANPANQYLVLTLGEHKLYPEKSFLPDLPGGIVDPGESEREAVVREVKEECSIDLNPNDLQLVFTQTDYRQQEAKSITRLLYIVRLKSTPTIALSWEHSSYTWVSLEELRDIDFRSFAQAVTYTTAHELIQ